MKSLLLLRLSWRRSPAIGGRGRRYRHSRTPSTPVPQTRIDKLVLKKLKQLAITPPPLCSDAVFVRRVYLDVIGTLPTAQEAWDFLQDHEPDKRAAC